MAIEHNTIVSTERHEPKGVETADVDQVYVADGLGSGSWKTPGGALFGDMDFTGNAVAHNITAASASSGTAGWIALTGANLTTPGALYAQGVADTISFENTGNNELLRVPIAGIYEISFNASFSGGGGGAGNVYRFGIAVNGAEDTTHAHALRQTSSTSNWQLMILFNLQ